MISEIYQYLKSDTKLVQLLNHSQSNKKIFDGVPKTYGDTTKLNEDGSFIDFPYIVYDIFPYSVAVHGKIKEYRLKITIVSKRDMLDSLSDRLIEMLHMGNKPGFQLNSKTIFHSRLMIGGSILFHQDLDVYEQIMYFHLKVK